jgi:hypothetical protein
MAKKVKRGKRKQTGRGSSAQMLRLAGLGKQG